MLFLYHQNTAQVQAGKGDNMKQTLFEIVAENGQVLDHGFRTIENSRTVEIRYASGKHVTTWGLSKTVLAFILRIDVMAFENKDSILYKEVTQ